MRKSVQAKDISDLEMLEIVRDVKRRDGSWATSRHLHEALPAYPKKVIRAKARALVLRGLMTGCSAPGCTCRGEFELTSAGRELLASS